MKSIITLILIAFVITTGIAQEKNIVTKSVQIDNLIPFVIQNFPTSNDGDDVEMRNITFLIQVSETNLSIENQVVLKQAFKLLSNRLSEDDLISIVTYSGFNGIALKQTEPGDLKKLLYTINNLKSSVKEFHVDGIELAYNYTNDNFEEEAINTVVMVRNPNASINANTYATPVTVKTSKKKNGAVLITAISLLPELISVIKN
jgi:hypothetical protein